MTVVPFRRPEPTPEEVEAARAAKKEALRLIAFFTRKPGSAQKIAALGVDRRMPPADTGGIMSESDAPRSRGAMIRQLDEIATRLADGPMEPEEQQALAARLARLLPAVSRSLQDAVDYEYSDALLERISGAPNDGTQV